MYAGNVASVTAATSDDLTKFERLAYINPVRYLQSSLSKLPRDMAFISHHPMIDRLWMLWQARDPASRQYALNSSTIFCALMTLDVTVGYGGNRAYLGPAKLN